MSKAEALDFLTEEEAKVQREVDEEARTGAQADEKKVADDAAAKVAADAKAVEDKAAADEVARVAAENVAKPATTAASPATSGEPATMFIPVMVAEAPADFDARMKAIGEAKAALPKKYDDGEITLTEFQAESDRLSDEKHELQTQQREAQNAARTNEANATQVWKQTVDMYKEQNPDLKNPVLAAAWDASLKEVLKGDGNDDKSMYWFLKEAHAQMRKTLGMDKATTTTTTTATDTTTPPKRSAPAAPTTLHDVPSTTRTDTGKDEFAELDNLSGIDAEMAVDRMARADPQKYQRYLENR